MAQRKRARPGDGIPASTKAAEGKALHALWIKRKRRTQAEFAADCGFTQGYIQQFFGGLRPLTLDLAVRFAEELNIEISDFSPRLAAEFDQQMKSTEWPFVGFNREQYLTLTAGQRIDIEDRVKLYLAHSGALTQRKLRSVR